MKLKLSWLILLVALQGWAEPAERIFASILPQKFVLERLAAPEFEVEALVGPGQSPATYDPSPRQMARLAEARALFTMDVPFERAWLPKIRGSMTELEILAVSPPPGLVHSHEHHHHHGDELDPHFWTSPLETRDMVLRLKDALAELSPEHAPLFEERAKLLADELESLDAELEALFEDSKEHRFMVFHPAWGHFAKRYELEQIAIEQEGKEPGAKSLAASIERARSLGIEVIFVQEQFGQESAEAVAAAVGACLQSLDPLAEDYLSNLRLSARAIAEALR